jgi:RHS repeat-associated protein
MRKSIFIISLIVALFAAMNPVFAGRYYIPEIGRWATPDPALQKMHPNELVSFQGGKLLITSPYAYSYNNPLRYTDPDGNTPWDILDIAAAGLSLKDFIQNPT